jgi:hypothetical protein
VCARACIQWQTGVLTVRVVAQALTPLDCTLLRDDYLECLHHRKEYARLNTLQTHKDRAEAEAKRAPPSPASVKF